MKSRAPVIIVVLVAAGITPALQPLSPAGRRGGGEGADDLPLRPLFVRHCQECHGTAKVKGGFRWDRLTTDFADAANRDQWLTVLKRVQAGEMPPKEKPRLAERDIRDLTEWINGRVEATNAARRAEGRVVLRRLNRIEYQNTLCDLLAIKVDLQEMLPLDGSAGGFDNVGEALHVSSFLMERYLEAADTALGIAIANGPKPALIKKRYDLRNQHQVKSTTESVFRLADDAVVLFSSSPWQAVTLYEFYPPDRGQYRFRISARGVQCSGKPVVFRVDAGPMLMATKNHLVGYFDAPADKPAVVDFVEHLEARSTIRILPYGLASAATVHKEGADKYQGPGLAVQWVEVEGPLYDSWPPPSHRRIFGDLPQTPTDKNRNRVEVVSKNPEADAERILRAFCRRAFRRTVTDDDIRPFLKLVKSKLAAQPSFEQAIRVGLLAVMVSPEFLFLREYPLVVPPLGADDSRFVTPPLGGLRTASPPKGGTTNEKANNLDDFALASRLSYFLWSAPPDEKLLTLAEQRQLNQPDVLRQQVERLLNDPRSAAFIENFVGQWLGLRDIDFTMPSHILYPEYDDMLRASMVRETELFFGELLKNDLSLTNFVASDFAILNGRLAQHYGIPFSPLPAVGEEQGMRGSWEFRRVPLPPDSHRGGVLTMASVLKVTANGTNTSPVTRGAWVLERILGTPPPRPPADVPALEPDIRGATTIREQLAKHRQLATCASCHSKIDPPGFALESFDVIGGWREHYRTSGNGKPVTVDGRRMHYLEGPKVDPADEFQGERFANIDEFKQLLLRDKDQLARALTQKLLTYATGGVCAPADQPDVEAIVTEVRKRNYGFRTLVNAIVQSKVFRNK